MTDQTFWRASLWNLGVNLIPITSKSGTTPGGGALPPWRVCVIIHLHFEIVFNLFGWYQDFDMIFQIQLEGCEDVMDSVKYGIKITAGLNEIR